MTNRVDGSLNNLVQGVSQQAPRDRLPGQCTEQLNCVSDPVRGLSRRSPSKFISSLANALTDPNARWHTYDRGDDEKYIVAFTNGVVKVWDLLGSEKTINGTAQTYLATTDAKSDISVHTIGDFTFIANKQATPSHESTNTLNAKLIRNGAIFTLDRTGSYSQVFSIYVDGTTVTYTIPDEAGAANENLDTWGINTIMQGLAAGFTKTGYSVAREDNSLYIYKDDPDDATPITARAESDNNGLRVVSYSATSAVDLPRVVPHGLVIKIAGGVSSVDDFWMRSSHKESDPFTAARSQTLSEGYWLECADPDALNEIDPDTMPHALVRMPDGTFHFAPLNGVDRVDDALNVVANPTWSERLAGDVVTNRSPSFIGEPINGIASFQGRLVLLAGEALIASTTEDYFDFWKKSATTLIASDRIDITANTDKVATLQTAVQHNRNLVVFSENTQFLIPGRQAFQPSTAVLTQTTVFEADLNADPLANGQNVLFGINYGQFAGLREFYTDSQFDTDNAEPITRQVERFLPGRVTNIAGSTDYNAAAVTTTGSPLLFLYQYLWAGQDKVQASWSSWSLTDSVVHAFFVQSEMYLVKQAADLSYYLTSLDMRDVTPTGLLANVYLDLQVALTSVTDTVTVPTDYPVAGSSTLVAVQGIGCPNPGLQITITDRTGDVLTLAEDMLGGTVYVGVRYTSRYVPTMPSLKDRNGISIGTGELMVQQFYVTFVETGALSAYADTDYNESFVLEEYTGRKANAFNNILGVPAISDDTLIVPYRFPATTSDLRLETDSYLPFRLTEIEWVGKYTKRGKRV